MPAITQAILATAFFGGAALPPPSLVTATFSSVNDGGYGYWSNNGNQTAASAFSGLASMPSYSFADGSSGTPFDLAGGYVIGPAIDNLGTNEITINIWFYPTANSVQIVSEYGAQDPSAGYHYSILEIDSNGYIRSRFWPNGAPGLQSANTVNLNAWNHVWYTSNASGTEQLRLNNGQTVLQNTAARQGINVSAFAFGVSDGTNLGNTAAFQGKIGYFQYNNDATTGSIYTSTAAKFLGSQIIAPTTVAYSPFGSGTSYVFDGATTGAAFSVDSLGLDPAGADWCVEGYFMQTANPTPFPRVLAIGSYPSTSIGISLEGSMYFWMNGGVVTSTAQPAVGSWNHFAFSRVGSTTYIYLNGNLVASTATNIPSLSGQTLYVGNETGTWGNNTNFAGFITNLRWTVGNGVYTGNFTIPSSALQTTQSAGTNINEITAGQVKLLY